MHEEAANVFCDTDTNFFCEADGKAHRDLRGWRAKTRPKSRIFPNEVQAGLSTGTMRASRIGKFSTAASDANRMSAYHIHS